MGTPLSGGHRPQSLGVHQTGSTPVYRSVPFFTRAFHRGTATDPVAYFAANAKLFGILKWKRRPKPPLAPPLDSPGPDPNV